MYWIIPESSLTSEDIRAREEYYADRNLYNKYSEEDLNNFLKVDLYEALDLDFLRFKPIKPDMLRHAVHRKSVEYHPTKNGGRREAFILITKARDIFSNKYYKAVYDSHLLDESIPEDREYTLEEFLDVFTPVFERNGVFSEAQPVPSLRGPVDVFYRFWNDFKTTRSYDDPADVFDQSNGSRKYYAELKKDELQKKKSADIRRVRELVSLSYRRDPRIKRAKRAESSKPWNDAELKALRRFSQLLGKSKTKYADISIKLNNLYLSNRTPDEVRRKLDSLKNK